MKGICIGRRLRDYPRHVETKRSRVELRLVGIGALLVRLIAVCMAALGVLVVGAGVASAGTGYKDVCASLGQPAFCTAEFSDPFGVAVDNSGGASNGDVFGVAKEGKDVEKFNADGAPDTFTGITMKLPGRTGTSWTSRAQWVQPRGCQLRGRLLCDLPRNEPQRRRRVQS